MQNGHQRFVVVKATMTYVAIVLQLNDSYDQGDFSATTLFVHEFGTRFTTWSCTTGT